MQQHLFNRSAAWNATFTPWVKVTSRCGWGSGPDGAVSRNGFRCYRPGASR